MVKETELGSDQLRRIARSMIQRRPTVRLASYEDAQGRKHELLAACAGEKAEVVAGKKSKRQEAEARCARVVICDRPAKRGTDEPIGAVAVLGASETHSVGGLLFDYLETAQLEVVPGFREVTPADLGGLRGEGVGVLDREPQYRAWSEVRDELLSALREDVPFEADAAEEEVVSEEDFAAVMEAVPA